MARRTARTDGHRPSAINPEEYVFVACDYFGPYGGIMMAQERKSFRLHMERTGGKHARKENSGTCYICGAVAMYVARYYHRPSNTYIVTGEDCSYKMDMGQPEAFKVLRAEVSHERQITKGKAVAREMLALLGLSDAYRVYEARDEGREESIIYSIVAKLIQYGNMSEKQAALLAKLLGDIATRTVRQAEYAAKRAAEVATSNWIGEKGQRRDFELTVTFTTSFETQFGTLHVHNMTDAAGNVVVYKGGRRIAARGETIKVKATIKEHGTYKDVKQTVIARPVVG